MTRLLVTGGSGYLGSCPLANAGAALPARANHGCPFSRPLLRQIANGLKLLEELGSSRGGRVPSGSVGAPGPMRARDFALRSAGAQLLSQRLRFVDEVLASGLARSRHARYCEGQR